MHGLSVAVFAIVLTLNMAFDARLAVRQAAKKHQILKEIRENEFDQLYSRAVNNELEFTSRHLLSIFSQLTISSLHGLSQTCKEDFELVINAIAHPIANKAFITNALIPMVDSSGKIGPAILRGHMHFAGHYSECKEVNFEVEERTRHFEGEYFRVSIDPYLRPNNRNDSCSAIDPKLPEAEIYWELGICLPASCTSAELQNTFRPKNGSSLIPNPVCKFTKPGDLTPDIGIGFYVTTSMIGIIVVVCIISGFIDFYFTERLKETENTESLAWKLFMSFSLYTNISQIFDSSEATKAGQIGPLHCIRFFSMLWVLLTHLLSYWLAVVANPLDILSLAQDLSSEVIVNGFFSVDSFFFMSGLLLTFLWFKIYDRQPNEVMSVNGWTMFYIHRFLRLSPAFYMLIIFYTFVFKQMIRDTPLSMNAGVTADTCSDTWWVEMLYLSNYVYHNKPCLGYSWYLAADMQMFLFTPLIIIPLTIKPILGFTVAAVIFVISTTTNIFLVFYYHWPDRAFPLLPVDAEQTNIEDYAMLMYTSPLIRCQIYIMGMLVGWFLQTRKHISIRPFVYVTAWVIGFSLMLTVLLGLHDETKGTEVGLFWRAMYSAFNRPVWGIGLSIIVVLSYYGYGGPINAFMSWHIWVPLGRLSYSAYLLHIPVIQLVLSQGKDEEYFSNFIEFFITRVVSITAVTFFFATFWSACFEISFGRVEKLLLERKKTPHLIETLPIIDEEEASSEPE